MKKSHLLVLGLFVLLAAFAFASTQPAPANAQQIVLEGRTLYNVNIRTAPGTNRPIIDVLPAASTFNVIGRNDENTWVQVEYQDTVGWSASWLFIYDKDSFDLPVTTEVVAPPASDLGPFDVLVPFNLNVRGAASTNTTVIDEIPYLTKASAVARDASNSWVLIEYNSGTYHGWVALWKVVILGDVGQLPLSTDVFSTREVNPSAPTLTVTPTVSDTPAATGTFTHSLVQGAAPICNEYTATNVLGFPVDQAGQTLILFDRLLGTERAFARAYRVDDSAYPPYINIDGSGEGFASDCNATGDRCTTATITLCASTPGGVSLVEKRFDMSVTLHVGYQSFNSFVTDQTFSIPVSVIVQAP